MTVKKSKYPLVYVEWEDAEHEGGWSDLAEEVLHRLGTIASIGWLIHEDKQRIVVASSVARGSLQIGNKQYIPTDQIRKIKKMRQAG
jgi:hypothetical protein